MEFLKHLKTDYPYILSIAVLPDNREYIRKCLEYGLTEYLIKDDFNNYCLKCKIKKLLLKENNKVLEIHSKGGIYLNSHKNEIYVGDRIVHLTTMECMIMKYLLLSKRYCNTDRINKYFNMNISKEALTMLISRLRRKFKYNTGYSLIRCKYGKGYYLKH